MKLRTILQKLDLQSLRDIAAFWNFPIPQSLDLAAPDAQPKLVEYLYPRMQTAKYFFRTVAQLDPKQQQLLKFLAVHGGEVPLSEVVARCFSGDEEAHQAVKELGSKAFIFLDTSEPEHEYVVLPESVLSNFELGNQLSGFLGALLQKMPFNDLAALAERVTGDKKCWNTSRERVVRRLREFLLNPRNLRRHIQALPAEERLLFNALVERDGYAFYGDLLEVGGGRRFDLGRTEQLNSLIKNRGIVFQVSEGSNKYANLLMIPRDILYIISHDFVPDTRSLSELEQIVGGTQEFCPAVVVDNSNALLRDLVVVASLIQSSNFRALANGGISRADLRRLLGALGPHKGLKYVTFLAAFLIWGKYINPIRDYWRLSDSFAEALKNPAHLYAELFNWWLEVNDWNEAEVEGLIWDEDQPTRGFVGLIEMRQIVLESLWSVASGGSWIPYPTFEELVLPKLAATTSSGGRLDPKIRASLRRILYCIVTEPLTWLGMTSLGASEKGAFAPDNVSTLEALNTKKNLKKATLAALNFSFRPTELARSLFELGAIRPRELFHEVAPESFPLTYSAGWIILQPNCEIVAPPDLSLSNLLCLCGFCEIRNVDVMTSLAVTRDSLQRALDAGLRGEDVRGVLSNLSRTGIPDMVQQLIADCLEKHGEAFLGSASGYLLADDPAIIEQVRLHGKLDEFIKEVVADRALIFAPGANLEKIGKELRGLGLMPRVEVGTVEASSANRFHLSLSAEDYYELLALLGALETVESILDVKIIDERAEALIRSLEPDSAGLSLVLEEARRLEDLYERRISQAFEQWHAELEARYKEKLARLVARAGGHRGPTRYHYRGQNPAVDRDAIVDLLKFAAEHDLETEIHYVNRNEAETTLRVHPKSLEGSRLYAHCVDSDRDAIYSLDRILKAKLL